MKLYEVLSVLSYDTKIFIQNYDEKRKKGNAQFQLVRNVTLEKIRNILDYDVIGMSVSENKGGLYIQVCRKDRLYERLNNNHLVQQFFHMKDFRERR